jgi:hypothetical protein
VKFLLRAGFNLVRRVIFILHLHERLYTCLTPTMKLKEIHRTSTFAWSPFASLPLLATGTVAGALDESFSNESQLEIWAPDFLDRDEFYLGVEGQHGPKGQVKDTARFVALPWQQILVLVHGITISQV